MGHWTIRDGGNMLKSELLEKLKDIAEDADVNETILCMDDFAKSSEIDVTKITLDDYKNMLANNEIVKAYFTSQLDSGIQQSDKYHTRSNLIYAFGKPTSGTITFKNCIIKKPEGGLLSGYGGTASDFNVEIIFEKTGVSSNLTVDSTYTSNVTITKK